MDASTVCLVGLVSDSMTSPVSDVAHYYHYFRCKSKNTKITIIVQRQTDVSGVIKEIQRINRKFSKPIACGSDHSNRCSLPAPAEFTVVDSKNKLLSALSLFARSINPSTAGFLLLSSHGYSGIPDTRQSESDGKNEYFYVASDRVQDDDLFDNVVTQVGESCTLCAVIDTCSSGTMLDLPWVYANGVWRQENNLSHLIKGKIVCWSACGDHQFDQDDLSSIYGYSGGLSSYVLDLFAIPRSNPIMLNGWNAFTAELGRKLPNLVASSSSNGSTNLSSIDPFFHTLQIVPVETFDCKNQTTLSDQSSNSNQEILTSSINTQTVINTGAESNTTTLTVIAAVAAVALFLAYQYKQRRKQIN